MEFVILLKHVPESSSIVALLYDLKTSLFLLFAVGLFDEAKSLTGSVEAFSVRPFTPWSASTGGWAAYILTRAVCKDEE